VIKEVKTDGSTKQI